MPDEYLALDRAADEKSEYISGEMLAMAGGSDEHEAISTNLAGLLFAALRGKPCRPRATSNLRVRVRSTDYLYPDALVFCGKPEFTETDYLDTLTNPTVVFEILSRSMEHRDRFSKAAWYESIPSVQQYVYITQDRMRVEVFTRQPSGDWLKHIESGPEGVARISSIDVDIALSDLYEDSGVDPSAI